MIEYIGEHTNAGLLGNFFVILAFSSAFLSTVSYFLAANSANTQDKGFLKIGRIGFWMHSLSIFGIVAVLFNMLLNHYFEYNYVWSHSNMAMPVRYILSCFWEGQEGSFLLWLFWHVVLANILIKYAGKWEAPVLSVISLTQVFLSSMLLGIYVLDYKIGSNPFTLIRNMPESFGLPWTSIPDYLQKIPQFQDGRGLNPLLQNYWMTIHPPTLFLGFASTLIPFAYGIAGLWKKEYKEWIRPAIPWTFFGVCVLGIGILMGGAWAYEALSFGGFWAWDPVENASLVPWLILVGAAHVMMINRQKDNSLFTVFFLTFGAFLLVLYSTFLTRSGVLGDTSVHSFTGDGMIGQLLAYLLFFMMLATGFMLLERRLKIIYYSSCLFLFFVAIIFDFHTESIIAFILISFILLYRSYTTIFPKKEEEEKLWSREFWIFIGSLVLMLSALQISFETSKPVVNLLAKPFSSLLAKAHEWTGSDALKALSEGKMAPKSDVKAFYNKWQVPFAFVVTFLIAIGQFFRYKDTTFAQFGKKIASSLIVSLIISIVVALLLKYKKEDFSLIILLFTSIFAIVANTDYLIRILKGKMDHAGASIAHIGFALIILGALISTSKSEKVSKNLSGLDIAQLSKDFDNDKDILLFKGDTMSMNQYFLYFKDKTKEGVNVYYNIDYFGLAPNHYKENTLVVSNGLIFKARKSHVPTNDFIADMPNWETLANPTTMDLKLAKPWNPNKAGDYLFTLHPRIQLNPKFGNVAEPDTKHYLDKDVYTHVRWADLSKLDIDKDGYLKTTDKELNLGDTIFSSKNIIIVDSMRVEKNTQKYHLKKNDLALRAKLRILDSEKKTFFAEPLFIIRDSSLIISEDTFVSDLGMKFSFKKIDPETGKITISYAENANNQKEFIVMQAIVFPMINILWIGTLFLLVGTILAIRHRYRLSKKLKSNDSID
jgi:cytochrome c-type biogenesis protein CcmF